MTLARTPGPLSGPRTPQAIGGTQPGVAGLRLHVPVFATPKSVQPSASKGKALIVIGTGHESMEEGVRRTSRQDFKEAALATFASQTKGYSVEIKFIKRSAKEMKSAIENGNWDVVIYFGHGVMNQQALAPFERGARLEKADLVAALKAAKTSKVYLFGCRAGWTGLARSLSKELPGTTVYGTFTSLTAEWHQGRKDSGEDYNYFEMKTPLTEYTDGNETKNGKKTRSRRAEMNDKVTIDPQGDPLADPTVAQ